MNTPAAQISVMAGQHFACVKIQGRATFTASLDFNALLNQLRARGVRYFVIELSGCTIMDSTFLGVLARFGLELHPDHAAPDPGCVELRNANARLIELLDDIGVLHLFKTAEGELASPEQLECFALECRGGSREEITRTCLEAHQALIGINPKNEARFQDVTRFLAEDLARMTKSPGK